MRGASTRGWDFLLEEEEDAIRELERIEMEMESQREREIRANKKKPMDVKKLDNGKNKRFHMSVPVPPKPTVDRSSLVGSRLGLPPHMR